MRNQSILFTAVTAIVFTAFTTAVRADWVEDAVKDIRAKYNQIEGWKKQSATIKFEADDGPESATMKRHVYNGQTVQIDLEYSLGDHGGATVSYYYHGGQLFFAFRSMGSWSFTGKQLPNGESETVDSATEDRIYFKDNQVIRMLRKDADSKDGSALGKILAKTENYPVDDPGLAAEIQQRAYQLLQVQNSAGLKSLFIQ